MQLTRNNPNQIILDIRESQAAFGIFPLYLEMPLIFTDFSTVHMHTAGTSENSDWVS